MIRRLGRSLAAGLLTRRAEGAEKCDDGYDYLVCSFYPDAPGVGTTTANAALRRPHGKTLTETEGSLCDFPVDWATDGRKMG